MYLIKVSTNFFCKGYVERGIVHRLPALFWELLKETLFLQTEVSGTVRSV